MSDCPTYFAMPGHHDTESKANIINKEFQSVFSNKSPLFLDSSCNMKLQDMYDTNQMSPSDGNENFYRILDIRISANSMKKLLVNLNPDKASAPDHS